jgi:subtilisin family serine protease
VPRAAVQRAVRRARVAPAARRASVASALVELDVAAPARSGSRQYGFAHRPLERAKLPRLELGKLDPCFGVVPLRRPAERSLAVDYGGRARTSVVRVVLDDPRQIEDLVRREGRGGVVTVYADPAVQPFAAPAVDCAGKPTGTAERVRRLLGARAVHDVGLRGKGVVVGIVDGGVDRERFPVIAGWSPDPAHPWGEASAWDGHGDMCAFDALVAAPGAKLHDLGIGKAIAGGPIPTVAAALQAYQWALERFRRDGTPQVLSNSWGLYQAAWDPFPPGDPRNYADNPRHPFMRKAMELMDAGILIVFAAGNCGAQCPSPACGDDAGPGRSIRGVNGLDRTICVGAVNLRGERVGYSSQGPSTLGARKPDLCGYTQFRGHTRNDSGTSAACPVVAGVLALLRSGFGGLTQDAARALLNQTARAVGAPGHDPDTGYGIVDAARAYERLCQQRALARALRLPRPKPLGEPRGAPRTGRAPPGTRRSTGERGA